MRVKTQRFRRPHVRRAFGAIAAAFILGLAAPPASVLAAPPQLRVHHLQVSVADADALAKWYVDKLGFKVVKRASAGAVKVVWIDIPGFRLGLAQVPGSIRAPVQKVMPPKDVDYQGYKQIHFAVPSVDAAYQGLKAEGGTFLTEPKTFDAVGIRIAAFADPEGNVISLYEDTDPGNGLMKAP